MLYLHQNDNEALEQVVEQYPKEKDASEFFL
jgi:hypothetical protein